MLRALLFSSGLLAGCVAFSQPSVVGEWGPVENWPSVSVHTHVLPTGKVMFYPYADTARVWDPANSSITKVPTAGYNFFCSGHSHIPDGRLLVTGGQNGSEACGENKASYYDPFANTWTPLPDMTGGRWYPSSTTLASGDVLVHSGFDPAGVVNDLPQVWQVANNSWRNLTDARLGLTLYPRTFLAPNGKVFFATSVSRYLDTSGTGAWSLVGNTLYAGHDGAGSACIDGAGKVYWFGGGDPPTGICEKIDLTGGSPAWSYIASMPQQKVRRQHNVTILPDGKFLITGGSASPGGSTDDGPKAALLYDPWPNTWTTLATEDKYRGYHSCANLLPDGRVLSSGGDNYPSAQVFSPPYLFKGPRPTITSAPSTVSYGQVFFVGTPDAYSVTKATWTRLGSTTHAQNWDQRINVLNVGIGINGLNITAPSDPNLCPPGYYMLWIISSSGVPSISRMIRISQAGPPPPAVPPPAAPASAGRIDYCFAPALGANGPVNALALQVDGLFIIGGDFTQVGGENRNRIARLHSDGRTDVSFLAEDIQSPVVALALQLHNQNQMPTRILVADNSSASPLHGLEPDGEVDTSFSRPSITGPVHALLRRWDDEIFIGGAFTQLNGAAVQKFARLNSDGTTDTTFNHGSSFDVHAFAVQPGKLIIGGNGVQRRDYENGSIDTTFVSGTVAGGLVRSLAVQPDGKVLVGGDFTSYNGVTRNRMARLHTDGSLDLTFDPAPNGTVYSISCPLDVTEAIIAGAFTTVGGANRNRLARLNTDGSNDAAFDPGSGANGDIRAIGAQTPARLVIAGTFTSYNGNSRGGIARVHRTTDGGQLDTGFNPGAGLNPGGGVNVHARQTDGRIVIGGAFSQYNGAIKNNIACLNTYGSLDSGFTASVNSSVFALAVQADGKILVGGAFTEVNGEPCGAKIARLHPATGARDVTFYCPSVNSYVRAIAVQPDGKIVVGGEFTTFSGDNAGIVRLMPTAGLDPVFLAHGAGNGANGPVNVVTLQPDGKILIGGYFSTVGGHARGKVARLNSNGSVDTTFGSAVGANSTVWSIVLQPDGRILVAGAFSQFNGVNCSGIVRLYAYDGSVDQSFISAITSPALLRSVAYGWDGKIYVGGTFAEVGDTPRSSIARLHSYGALDSGFNPGTGLTGGSVAHTLGLLPDGKLFIGGVFSGYNGVSRSGVVRVWAE